MENIVQDTIEYVLKEHTTDPQMVSSVLTYKYIKYSNHLLYCRCYMLLFVILCYFLRPAFYFQVLKKWNMYCRPKEESTDWQNNQK